MKNKFGYIAYIVAVIFFIMWLVSQNTISNYQEIVEIYKATMVTWEDTNKKCVDVSNRWENLYYKCKGKTLPATQGKSAYFDGDRIVLVEPPD